MTLNPKPENLAPGEPRDTTHVMTMATEIPRLNFEGFGQLTIIIQQYFQAIQLVYQRMRSFLILNFLVQLVYHLDH